MKLYMFYVGGNAGRSNIEVHDIQFCPAVQVEDAYPSLREAWFGDKDKLHLDGYRTITWADGFDVTLSQEIQDNQGYSLFFVNAGGYTPDNLAEQHAFELFVAKDANEAKDKAMQQLLVGLQEQHKDNLKDVDNCLALEQLGSWHVKLTPNAAGKKDSIAWQGYRPIGI